MTHLNVNVVVLFLNNNHGRWTKTCPRTTLFWLRFLGLQGYQQKGWFRLGLVCWSFHHSLKVADNPKSELILLLLIRKTAKKATPKPQSDVSRKMHHVPYDFFIRFPVCMANVVQGCCWQLPYACSRNTLWSSQHVRRPVGCQLAGGENFRFFSRFFPGWKDTKSLRFEGGRICHVGIFSCCSFLVQVYSMFFFLIHSTPKNLWQLRPGTWHQQKSCK